MSHRLLRRRSAIDGAGAFHTAAFQLSKTRGLGNDHPLRDATKPGIKIAIAALIAAPHLFPRLSRRWLIQPLPSFSGGTSLAVSESGGDALRLPSSTWVNLPPRFRQHVAGHSAGRRHLARTRRQMSKHRSGRVRSEGWRCSFSRRLMLHRMADVVADWHVPKCSKEEANRSSSFLECG